MNLREVREAAEQCRDRYGGVRVMAKHILSTIDPSPDELVDSKWLNENYKGEQFGEEFSFSGQQYHWMRGELWQGRYFRTSAKTRQQFCDLARALGIQRRTKHAIEPMCTCLDSPNMLYAPCSYCDKQRKDGGK